MFSSLLVLLLIIKFKLKCATNGFYYFNKYYGADCLRLYRKLHNSSIKLNKLELDLDFLTKCKVYNVIPKFLRFKLYKKSLHNTNFYSSWQTKLLNNEIKFKKKNISRTKDELAATSTSFRTIVSQIDFYLSSHFIKQELSKRSASMKVIHRKKT